MNCASLRGHVAWQEYMAFLRATSNKNKFKSELAEAFERDRCDLFNVWLQNNRDFDACLRIYTRRSQEQSHRARVLHGFRSRRQLLDMYSEDHVQQIISKCEANNHYREDPNVPGAHHCIIPAHPLLQATCASSPYPFKV